MSMLVSSDFQITLPPDVREQMGIKPGDRLALVGHPKNPRLVRVPTLDEMIGSMEGCDVSGYRDEGDRV